MTEEMTGSRILSDLLNYKGRVRVLEGGSRSSKTFSIIQFLILYCQDAAAAKTQKRITICRQKLTWLKGTLLPDFIKVLRTYGFYSDANFHKSEMTYNLFGCTISFIGLDEPQKLHGRTQDVFWINEAIEATADDFDQLEMRTTEFCILDYNPSATEHWIFNRVLTREDVDFNHSTMLDNPFLEQSIIDKIYSYEPNETNNLRGTADENKWKIYGLGLRSQIEGLIFTNVGYVREMPELAKSYIGLDFGFTNDPTAIIRIGTNNGQVYGDELCYRSGMTNTEIDNELRRLGVGRSELIVADSSEPKSIAELSSKGWNIAGATKGAGSVNQSIDVLKRYRINITERSVNWKKEASNYTWRKDRATSTYTNTPVDNFNHCWDAARYVAIETMMKVTARMPVRIMSRSAGKAWNT